jgi:hypothetical protein
VACSSEPGAQPPAAQPQAPSLARTSPTRAPADAANGKRPLVKDKEALRRQAADAMKAVELRSLNLLEGGLGASRSTRGVPMASVKSMASLCGGCALPQGPAPTAGIAGMPPPALPQPQLSNGSVPAMAQLSSGSIPAMAQLSNGSIPAMPPPPGAAAAAASAAARPQIPSQAAAVLVPPPSAS